jgi:hypothetical protein
MCSLMVRAEATDLVVCCVQLSAVSGAAWTRPPLAGRVPVQAPPLPAQRTRSLHRPAGYKAISPAPNVAAGPAFPPSGLHDVRARCIPAGRSRDRSGLPPPGTASRPYTPHRSETSFGGRSPYLVPKTRKSRQANCSGMRAALEDDRREEDSLAWATGKRGVRLHHDTKYSAAAALLRLFRGQVIPPRSVCGLEVVQGAIEDGWEYSYMVHNHTIQDHLDDPVPSVPVPAQRTLALPET